MHYRLNLIELAVTYTALETYLSTLKHISESKDDNDVKLMGEIKAAESSIEKIKHEFIAQHGNLDLLK